MKLDKQVFTFAQCSSATGAGVYSSTRFTVLSRAELAEKSDSAETCEMIMPRSSGCNAASLRGNSMVQQNRRGHVEDRNGNSELGAEARTLFKLTTVTYATLS